jgi:simple sugar transport system permease protein
MSHPRGARPDKAKAIDFGKIKAWMLDNIVTVVFIVYIIIGISVATDMPLAFFFGELSERFFRNAFLVLSLIIPVVAGLGLNFGIVIGAMAGQMAIIFVRYHAIEGVGGLLLSALIAMPLAALFGYLTGKLYNKTKGQEMIASLIVGYFANGVYQFILLFIVGGVIPVAADSVFILTSGIGVRNSVDLGSLKYALDGIWGLSFPITLLGIGLGLAAFGVYRLVRQRKNALLAQSNPLMLGAIMVVGLGVAVAGALSMAQTTALSIVKDTPVSTGRVVVLLCLFTRFIIGTKLGQDFRSVGQSQHIAETSGINVDRTRVLATIISTVLAAWGHIIYMQNMGTLATYDTHRNIGMFSVAALLVGGASTSKASVKNALIGTLLFNAMFIISPSIGEALFGQPLLGEYFRTFMVYGVIGVALGLYVWKAVKKARIKIDD